MTLPRRKLGGTPEVSPGNGSRKRTSRVLGVLLIRKENGIAGLLGIRSVWRRANFRHTGFGFNLLNGSGALPYTAPKEKNGAIDCRKVQSRMFASDCAI